MLLSTTFIFCLEYFFLPLQSLSTFYTSIFDQTSFYFHSLLFILVVCLVFLPPLGSFLSSLSQMCISILHTLSPTIPFRKDQNVTSRNPSPLICHYFLNHTPCPPQKNPTHSSTSVICLLHFELAKGIIEMHYEFQ